MYSGKLDFGKDSYIFVGMQFLLEVSKVVLPLGMNNLAITLELFSVFLGLMHACLELECSVILLKEIMISNLL